MTRIDLRRAVPAVVMEDGRWYYHDRLSDIRGRDVSGAYAIIDAASGRVLYVGESHTGRLYDTLTRHFRAWRPKRYDSGGGRHGGTTYDRTRVLVAWATCPPAQAVALQDREILRLEPRDNDIVPVELGDIPI